MFTLKLEFLSSIEYFREYFNYRLHSIAYTENAVIITSSNTVKVRGIKSLHFSSFRRHVARYAQEYLGRRMGMTGTCKYEVGDLFHSKSSVMAKNTCNSE
jgi:hypothetical protein